MVFYARAKSFQHCVVEACFAAPLASRRSQSAIVGWGWTWNTHCVSKARAVGEVVACIAPRSRVPCSARPGGFGALEESRLAWLALVAYQLKPGQALAVGVGGIATCGAWNVEAVGHWSARATGDVGCGCAGGLDFLTYWAGGCAGSAGG
jgi:hypothetical protein